MTDTTDLTIQLIASLTLADHLGDVSESIAAALKRLGEPWNIIKWDDLSDLRAQLGKLGVTTLYGSELTGE